MARDIDPENSEVRTLIINTLQAEERAQMDSDQESTDMSHRYDFRSYKIKTLLLSFILR